MSEHTYQCTVFDCDGMSAFFGHTYVLVSVTSRLDDSDEAMSVTLSHDDAKDLGERLINWAEANG